MMNPFHPTGRVALVTESSRGIGRAIALVLAEAGATVVFHKSRPGGGLVSDKERILAKYPTRRFGARADRATSMLFFRFDADAYITGKNIAADGEIRL